MFTEFIEMIKQQGVIGLAIAVVIGGKLNALVGSIVNGFLMPLTQPILPEGHWREATLQIGPFHFLPGPMVGAFVDFLIVAVAIFIVMKYVGRVVPK